MVVAFAWRRSDFVDSASAPVDHGAKRTILAGGSSRLRAAVPMLATAALVTIQVCAIAPSARAGPILFLVAEPEGSVTHGDSYVLPLEDPSDIEHARALIALGPAAGAPIAVAAIEAGADGVNRDVRAAGAPPWSWHVTGFDGFTDFTIEILDGWPSFVEQDVDGWIGNTGGFVGFWSYTVVEELPEADATGIALATVAGLGWFGRRSRRRDPIDPRDRCASLGDSGAAPHGTPTGRRSGTRARAA